MVTFLNDLNSIWLWLQAHHIKLFDFSNHYLVELCPADNQSMLFLLIVMYLLQSQIYQQY